MINAQLEILFIALMLIIAQGQLSKKGSALAEFIITLALAGLTIAHLVIVLRKGLSGDAH